MSVPVPRSTLIYEIDVFTVKFLFSVSTMPVPVRLLTVSSLLRKIFAPASARRLISSEARFSTVSVPALSVSKPAVNVPMIPV